MAKILKGAPVVAAMSTELVERVNCMKNTGITPTLAIVRVGERSDDIAYERGAVRSCEKVGVAVKLFTLEQTYEQNELMDIIRQINIDNSIHGCLMFRPLQRKEDELLACELLSPEKDVDCVTDASLSGVFTGKKIGFPPCTAQACIEMIDYYGIELQGKRVAVIGRSLVIGKPVSMMLQARNATVTMCHTKTTDLSEVCREANIIVAAAGKAGMLNENYTKSGQIILDVGINTNSEGGLCGDVQFEKVEQIVEAITPVPRGVGSVTSMVLVKHVILSAERYAGALHDKVG